MNGRTLQMVMRLVGVVLLLSLFVVGPVGIAAALEGGPEQQQPLPSFDEVGSQSDVAREYLPERYQEPSWFQWLLFPLLVVAILATGAVLFAYLVWQPKFANEQRSKRRR